MARKNRVIITNDKETYEKLNKLNFDSEISLPASRYISRILNKINKKDNILDIEKLDGRVKVRKHKSVWLNVYKR
jgi:hypothetical protein